MSGDRYQEFAPPVGLAPWVRVIWTYAAPSPSGEIQRIAPDGCPELVLDIAAPYEEQGSDGVFHIQPAALFAGQMTRPMAIRPVGPIELVAVRFHPDGARDWLGHALSLATDRRLDMIERLAGLAPPAGDPAEQVRTMVAWLESQRLEGDWTVDPIVRAEIDAIETDRPSTAALSSARRALQRRLLDRVGVSPRTLRSVCRFRRVFDKASDEGGWLQAGLDAGYFDQPQMARDFQRFLGCSATTWAREQVELARAIASQTYKPGPPHPA